MQEKEIKALLQKYQAGKCTEQEAAFLESWFAQWNKEIPTGLSAEQLASDLQTISGNIPALRRIRVRTLWPRIAAAASVLIFLSIGAYFLLHKQPALQTAQNQLHDVAPGGNKAVLVLANGKRIVLTDAQNGKLARQGNTTISKTSAGGVVYVSQAGAAAGMAYDTISTPRGGQYHLKMADGTIAWLNADTKLRYPEGFTGKERKVELISGEAYFEVEHNAAAPFKVMVKGQTIEDIGTHFEINAYDDEPVIKATLLEGSIRVSNGKQKAVLKPGQQSIIQPGGNAIMVKEVDAAAVIDWKNGEFDFKNEGLASIMRKISRWYDVQIVYKDNKISPETFSGSISRYGNVSRVLQMLEETGDARFEIKGKQIAISK